MPTLIRPRLTPRTVGLLAALALLAAGSLALLPAPLTAVNLAPPATPLVSGSGCFGRGTTTIYFSDASHTTIVGRYTSSCTGVCTGSGQITSFFEVAATNCPPGGGGGGVD